MEPTGGAIGAAGLAAKIARLVEERGWNQEDFARITQLNRQTVRQILQGGNGRRLRNATVSACARALGLTVSELRDLPLLRLLPRMHGQPPAPTDDLLKHLHERARQPELLAWLERNGERARCLAVTEVEELLSAQGEGGPLARLGVERYVEIVERRRKLTQQVHAIAGTEYIGLLEQIVGLLYEKVQPEERGRF
jgi:transcriptional regulator with XRE-family HTH domain